MENPSYFELKDYCTSRRQRKKKHKHNWMDPYEKVPKDQSVKKSEARRKDEMKEEKKARKAAVNQGRQIALMEKK